MSRARPEGATQEEWDAAQRMAEAVNLHVAVLETEGEGRTRPGYVAIRLADGRSPDGVLYDSRADATRHQSDPWNFYVKVGRASMPVSEALVVLQMARKAKSMGVVFTEEEVMVPHRLELLQPFIPRTIGAVRPAKSKARGLRRG